MPEPLKDRFSSYIRQLQDDICSAMEKEDGKASFRTDPWKRRGGGGGITRVMEKGDVFEKAGVNISEVHGELPELIRERFGVDHGRFHAAGLSLIVHPYSPMIPSVHANYRYFELYESENAPVADRWFGGGADLTPWYLWQEDVTHFHRTIKQACDSHGSDLYPHYKKECDEYFYNAHREECRGVGGVFFDYLREDRENGRDMEFWFDFVRSNGDAFLESYMPLVRRRRKEPFTEQQRYFQEIRRGRYAEFNLVYDRGTLFGLKTEGRVESILMSLPPRVRWDYNVQVKPGSWEAQLIDVLRFPRDWA